MKYLMLLVAAVALVMLASSATSASAAPQPTGYAVPQSMSGVIFSHQNLVGMASSSQQTTILISLKYQNENVLNSYLSALQNQNSPWYHKYMTQQQFIDHFSPSPQAYYSIINYFAGKGFSVVPFHDRVSLQVTGTYGQFASLFHTEIGKFYNGHYYYYAPISTVFYEGPYASMISNIVGLNNEYRAKVAPMFSGSGSSQTLYGSDMQVAYQLKQLYSKAYPTGKTIVTILWSGNDSTGASVAPFAPSDISYYFNHTLPAGEPKPVIYGYPVDGAPPPGPSAANDNSQANYESTLDLEMAGSTAPGANIVEVYGPTPTNQALDDAFAAALNNGSSFAPLNNLVAISNSWGGSDSNDSTWMQYEQQAAARGITVFASSGDDGNTGNAAPSFPATMSYNNFGTIAVGGAEMTLTGTASTDGSGTTGIASQAVWYNSPQSGDGSQGGVSSVFSEPSWQMSSAMANSAITSNSSVTGVSSGRGTPDISADGANMTIYLSTSSGASYTELWGTSVASPLAAGVVTTMDTYLGSNEGFMDPLIYKLGQAEANGSYSTSKPFYFVANGSNGDFAAANGYSLAVGWGTINAYNFVQDQSGTPVVTKYSVTFTESGLPSGTSWSVTLGGTAQQSTAATDVFTEANGSYSYTVSTVSGYTVSPSSGTLTVNGANVNQAVTFTQNVAKKYSVTFTESGLPSGTSWSVTLGGTSQQSTTTTDVFEEVNGSYSFTIGSVSGYSVSPASGTVNVNGAAVNQAIGFTASTGQASGIFSQVNATSANIQIYTLPEAEEFTVGGSNENVNFVVLYLSGAGSVHFSIGTSLWASNILGNQTVTATSSKLWYNVSFSSVTLTANTDYYLNVYLVSGSTQWGYTTSPSVAKNEVQDYWESGGYLSNDNSYPNIYSVGYSSGTPPPATYTITFTESGLSSGKGWTATFNNVAKSSTTTTISFTATDGSYSYSISAVSGYTVSPSSGTITVNGANVNQAITFKAVSSTHKLISQVNATSANIQTYTLQESEEFSAPGSGSVQGNYIVLYLSGSGSVQVSVGTSLWGTQIMSNETITVTSSKLWYNISVPAFTLTGGSDYYLNVYQASGSVQWGYTSSPSVDVNALQDYWFSGGTLYNDNSYPNIFTIGYF